MMERLHYEIKMTELKEEHKFEITENAVSWSNV